jgi:hypothetical protein
MKWIACDGHRQKNFARIVCEGVRTSSIFVFMETATVNLSPSATIGELGVMHLKRYWEKHYYKKQRLLHEDLKEWNIDNTLLAVLGLGLEQTLKYLYNESPGFAAFENWILEVNHGQLFREKISDFNAYISSRGKIYDKPAPGEAILSEEDLASWDKHGYVIIREAVSKENCEAAIQAICDFIEADLTNPSTWYEPHPARQGIMVQLFQHAALDANRRSPKIRAAYEQLWCRKDLWMNTDRAGFNPPETDSWKFPGPRLHWDVSLALPVPFGLQGILYLSDTKANQGAFTLVPGFQHRLEEWLKSLPPGANPRTQDLYALGTYPVVANAGDFIIWHHALPHGSSANTSLLPRIVQYINYAPLDAEMREEWI